MAGRLTHLRRGEGGGRQVLVLGVFTGTVFYQTGGGPERTTMDLRNTACAGVRAHEGELTPVHVGEQMVVYSPLVYWLTSFSGSQAGAHFLMFMLIILLTVLASSSLVRLIASISATPETGGALAGLCVVTMLLFTGFLISKNNIPAWWLWMYYVSPLQWSVTAIVANEFLSARYNQVCSDALVPSASYCRGRQGVGIGRAYLESYELPTSYVRGVWLGLGVLAAYYAFFLSLTYLATSRIRFNEVPRPPPPLLLHALVCAPPPFHFRRQFAVGHTTRMATTWKIPREREGLPSSNTKHKRMPQASALRQLFCPSTTLSMRCSLPLKLLAAAVICFQPAVVVHPHTSVQRQVQQQQRPDAGESVQVDIAGVREPRVLLSGVSGLAKPGSMTALMGSSGAGKTTLLDVLAGRNTMGRVRGDILINGFPKVRDTFARIAGYVEQMDIHTPYITVRESLDFSAALRLPRGTSATRQHAFVQEVMDLLELHPIANKLVGFIGTNGLAVEQVKRLTIGVELVGNPSILFLDEPTSGLDSHAAQIVINGVRNIANTGRSVICTIHQPSRRLFLAFNQLLLLKRGGEVAYFGPIGDDARDLLEYLQALPGVGECPRNKNPASFMLEIVGAGIGHAQRRDFGLQYKNSLLALHTQEELDRLKYGRGDYGAEPQVRGYAATWSTMASVVIMRQYKTYWRNVSYSFGRMMFSVVLGLLLGSTYWQIEYVTVPGLASRSGLIYIALIFVAIVNANVNAERPVYYREQAGNMYSSTLYNLSWVLEVSGGTPVVFCRTCASPRCSFAPSASPWLGWPWTARHFVQFWFIFFEYAAGITFFGILLAMLTPNAETATIIIPVVITIWNIMSGFLIPKSEISTFWSWLYWLNPTRYALNSLTAIAFYCDTEEGPCSPPGCELNPAACPACDCVRLKDAGDALTWQAIRSLRDLKYDSRSGYMTILFLFNVVFRSSASLAVTYMRFNKR
eukprot:jgi/Mesen1/3539/ME000198S02743